MISIAFLHGKNIFLRPFLAKDINENYLSWLNDTETSKFSRRRLFPTNDLQCKKYLSELKTTESVLAICTCEGKHIGNIKFGPINFIHRSADISIVIGDKNEWGKGYASEAIYLITKHLFNTIGLNRVEAGTVNPAFARVAEKLGWKKEGVFRKGYFLNNTFVDVIRVSLLKEEFVIDKKYEE
jgi:[ribosomal protein S5]-alanine N-acetyltransferase